MLTVTHKQTSNLCVHFFTVSWWNDLCSSFLYVFKLHLFFQPWLICHWYFICASTVIYVNFYIKFTCQWSISICVYTNIRKHYTGVYENQDRQFDSHFLIWQVQHKLFNFSVSSSLNMAITIHLSTLYWDYILTTCRYSLTVYVCFSEIFLGPGTIYSFLTITYVL